jgi:hypothetical protein
MLCFALAWPVQDFFFRYDPDGRAMQRVQRDPGRVRGVCGASCSCRHEQGETDDVKFP